MTALITFSGHPVVADTPRPDGAAARTRRWRTTRCSVCRICPHEAPNDVSQRKPTANSGALSGQATSPRAATPATTVTTTTTVTSGSALGADPVDDPDGFPLADGRRGEVDASGSCARRSRRGRSRSSHRTASRLRRAGAVSQERAAQSAQVTRWRLALAVTRNLAASVHTGSTGSGRRSRAVDDVEALASRRRPRSCRSSPDSATRPAISAHSSSADPARIASTIVWAAWITSTVPPVSSGDEHVLRRRPAPPRWPARST